MDTLCGGVMPAVSSRIYFKWVPQATSYRFSVLNTTTNVETFYENTLRYCVINGLSNYDFNTTFAIKCQVKLNGGAYGSFGPVCNINSPNNSTTALRTEYCGITVASLADNLYAKYVGGATAYKFKVTLGAAVEEIETTGMLFRLSQLASPQLGVTYAIEVSAKVNNIWGAYAASCNVSTPGGPTTQLRTGYCGMTVTAPNANIYSQFLSGADLYKYEVTDGVTTEEYTNLTAGSLLFRLSWLTSIVPTAGTTYTIKVAGRIGGTFMPYGTACTVTYATTRTGDLQANELEVSAYPNPFNNEFTIQLSNGAAANIQLFDINGRMIENRNVQDQFEITMGQNLNAGVYLVKVEQNGETNSFKMIKK